MSDFPNLFPANAGNVAGGNEVAVENGYATITAVEYPILSLNLYGKSVQDGVPTPDTPIDIVSVGDNGTINIAACGKNLLPFPYTDGGIGSVKTANGITFTVLNDGGIQIQGTATANAFFNLSNYRFSEEWIGYAPFTDGKIVFTGEKDNVYMQYDSQNSITSIVILQGRTVDTVYYPQVEKGTTATAYEPYTDNTATITTGLPLCSVGEYRDELVYNADGTGKIVKRIRKVVLDGSEPNWTMYATVSQKNRPSLNLGVERCIYGDYTTSSPSLILCDKYKSVSYLEITNGIEGIGLHHVEGRYLSIYDEAFATATIDEWKAHLADNPLTVIYVLNAPQEIELSATEMAELQKLQSYDGVTNIYNSEDAEMKVKVATNPLLSEYVKPVIDGITARYEARIAALEAAVTNT